MTQKLASSVKHTDSVTLPATTSLSKAGAVHHVSFIMVFSKSLVDLIGQAIHNTLVCNRYTKG